jgi:hypothetical protein
MSRRSVVGPDGRAGRKLPLMARSSAAEAMKVPASTRNGSPAAAAKSRPPSGLPAKPLATISPA